MNMKPRQTNLPTKSQTSSLAHHSFTHPRLCHQKETQHIETEESERCLPRAIVNHLLKHIPQRHVKAYGGIYTHITYTYIVIYIYTYTYILHICIYTYGNCSHHHYDANTDDYDKKETNILITITVVLAVSKGKSNFRKKMF